MAVHVPGIWGIDLGQCALKAVRLEVIDGEITATAFDYIEHPKILSQPDADPDALTREALDKFLSRNNLRGDVVVISVPGQSGLARFVKLPPVEEKKIDDIVRFEAKQQIPFPLDEVVWDYQKLSAGVVTDGFALETEIGLFAMKRDMVNRYLQHFQDVNVEVHIVQMAPLALCNFVSHDLLGKGIPGAEGAAAEEEADEDDEGSGKKQCIVALDIGTDNSNLVITDGEKIIWQRPIPLGGNHFTRALTKDLKLTFAKAEHVKRNAVKSPDLKKILASLRPVLNDFVGEVQRSLGYFTNTHRDAHVKYMVGLGNAFRLPGLQKFLQEKLQLEVRKLTGFKRLTGESVTTAPQFTENILTFAVAHGLALQGLQQTRVHTNLLPHEIRFERLIRAKKPWAVAAAALLLLGVAGLAFGRAREYTAYANPRVETALKKGEAFKDEAERYAADYTKIKDEAKASHEAVLKITGGIQERFNWNLLYQFIGEALPRPDGGHLPATTVRGKAPRKLYQAAGKDALAKALKQRAVTSGEPPSPEEAAKQEAAIKKKLIQVNIEGIVSLYSDDLPAYFTKLRTDKLSLVGMRPTEAELVKKGGEGLPKAGWVVEIRGYTDHDAKEEFITDTVVENLANPEAAGIKLSPEMKKQVRDRVKYVFLYKYGQDKDPQPGVYQYIGSSHLPGALGVVAGGPGGKGPGGPMRPSSPMPPGGQDPAKDGDKAAGPDRSAWRPLGEIASVALTGTTTGPQGGSPMAPKAPPPPMNAGPGGEAPAETPRVVVPRTEFVIFFIWEEPLPADEQAPAAPAAPTT